MKVLSWYFSKKALPYWGVFFIDYFIVVVSAVLAYTISYGPGSAAEQILPFWGTVFFYSIFYVIGMRMFHTYAGVMRYSSFVDLQYVLFAVAFGFACSAVGVTAVGLNRWLLPLSMNDLFLWALFSVVLMWSIRVHVKILYDSSSNESSTPIFIYGVKEGGIGIAKSLRSQNPSRYVLRGFVTAADDMVGHKLMGHRVHSTADFVDAMQKEKVKTVFISPLMTERFRQDQKTLDRLIDAGVKIFMMPKAQEWDASKKIDVSQLKEVEIEDLLPREKIEVDLGAIERQLRGKRVVITGAAGSIGSEIVRQVAQFGPAELTLIDQAETPMHDVRLMMKRSYPAIKVETIVADIVNEVRMREIFGRVRPHYVFHAAAYKHVPMMEDNPAEAVRNNIDGTRVIADLAVEYGAQKFVMISTDKAVNPTNVMGCSKRICEIYVQSLSKAIKEGRVKGSTQFVTTRFGNVLGSNGSVIPLFREQIKNGGPVTVTHPDIIRFFMLIPEACKLVLEAGTMGNGGEIFVFDMGEPVKIVDLAKRMIQLSQAENVEIKFTGLRDGEKLYEEVLNEKETTLPTVHPKIHVAKVREYQYDAVSAQIDALVKQSYYDTDMEIVRSMKRLVPEFKSQHSVYEQLDKAVAP